jgi:AcrR family transcriptional regulator
VQLVRNRICRVCGRWLTCATPVTGPLIAGTDLPEAESFIQLLAAEAAEPGLRKGERTRRRILWATADELTRTPFALLSMDAIAQVADVSRAALYQYVGSKEEAVRIVLTGFQGRMLALPVERTRGMTPLDSIRRAHRWYIDYFSKNAIFMERVRELHSAMPELIAERQKVNRVWADRVLASVRRHGASGLTNARLRIRILALECMIDDLLRELFVIRNPNMIDAACDPDTLAAELAAVWYASLYGS